MNWLEISLTVNGELAEAVADVLARYAPNGVTTEQAVRFNDAEDEGTPMGPITVRAYLPAEEGLEETRQRIEEALHYLGMIQTLPEPIYTQVPDQNWMEAWKARYQPIPIGKQLIIVPAWLESPDEARTPIKIDPGMAFGTGTHPTTQLCLEFVEDFLVGRSSLNSKMDLDHSTQPINVIDIGCGSGILSIGALKLGAGFALGVDIDDASVRASLENLEANKVNPAQFFIGQGSVQEVLSGKFVLSKAELVLANILAPVLIRLFDMGMAEIVEPGGTIILSGILEEQVDDVIRSAQSNGLELSGRKQIADWVAISCKKQI